jgi:hypothetical protein
MVPPWMGTARGGNPLSVRWWPLAVVPRLCAPDAGLALRAAHETRHRPAPVREEERPALAMSFPAPQRTSGSTRGDGREHPATPSSQSAHRPGRGRPRTWHPAGRRSQSRSFTAILRWIYLSSKFQSVRPRSIP